MDGGVFVVGGKKRGVGGPYMLPCVSQIIFEKPKTKWRGIELY